MCILAKMPAASLRNEARSAAAGQKLPDGFRYDKRGSIEFLLPRKTEDEDEVWAWLRWPLEVLAETRSEDEKGWGGLSASRHRMAFGMRKSKIPWHDVCHKANAIYMAQKTAALA